MPLLSVEEAKTALGRIPASSTAYDALIQLMIDSTVSIIENITGGPLYTRTIVERVTVTGAFRTLPLRQRPVVAVQSIVDIASNTAIPITNLDIDTNSGIVRRVLQLPFWSWGPFYTVTYTAGWGDGVIIPIPAAFKEVAQIIVAHLWRIQRGPYGTGDLAVVPGIELLNAYAQEAYV